MKWIRHKKGVGGASITGELLQCFVNILWAMQITRQREKRSKRGLVCFLASFVFVLLISVTGFFSADAFAQQQNKERSRGGVVEGVIVDENRSKAKVEANGYKRQIQVRGGHRNRLGTVEVFAKEMGVSPSKARQMLSRSKGVERRGRSESQESRKAKRASLANQSVAGFSVDFEGGWPEEARSAMNEAASIWEGYLETGSAGVLIRATWEGLGEMELGGGSPESYFQGVEGARHETALYPASLSNALSGTDLNGSAPEVTLSINSNVDWYYGTEEVPEGQVSFITVALHEIAHGLGFLGTMVVEADGTASWGIDVNGVPTPTVYDLYARDGRFARRGQGGALIDQCAYSLPSRALADTLTSGQINAPEPVGSGVFFSMPSENEEASPAQGGESIRLFNPPRWQTGTSYDHHGTGVNGLMLPSVPDGFLVTEPEVTANMLSRLGWDLLQ